MAKVATCNRGPGTHPSFIPRRRSVSLYMAPTLWQSRSVYEPAHRLEADLLLFKTELSERWVATDMSDPQYGWGQYTSGRIDVVNVEGGHRTMFGEDNQRRMADAVLGATAKLGLERAVTSSA